MRDRHLHIKRIGFGIGAMVTAGILLELFAPQIFAYEPHPNRFFNFQPLPTLEAAMWPGLVVFVGAYVAGVRFVIPAIAYYLIITAFAFHIIHLIAQPAQPMSYLEIAARNSLGTALGLVVVVVAAELGTALSRKTVEPTR